LTIAISLKVNDGVVLASDSATTILSRAVDAAPTITDIHNIYNNANKIFNLKKGKPIGAITWGAGSIGPASISTLVKDFRKDSDVEGSQWYVDWKNYSVESVATTFRDFFVSKYEAIRSTSADAQSTPMGFIVAGYGTNSEMAEEYQIDFVDGHGTGPRLLRPVAESGLTWSGEPEAITRLIIGFGTALPAVLSENFGLSPDQLAPALSIIQQRLQAPIVMPPMPIQDAIDLAEFLVDATIKFKKFHVGFPTVGGPIEIAAITKHEKFKWVQRKHYYKDSLNPPVDNEEDK
jgi:hypothetical protein